MFLAPAPAAIALNSYTPMFNNGSLVIYSGSIPATAATALGGGNIVLATYTFSPIAFSAVSVSGGFDVQNASFVSSTVSPSNSGIATFARATFPSTVWAGTTGYLRGAVVTKSSTYYVCILSGTSASVGPTGSTLAQIDGTTAWSFVGATSGTNVIAQMTVSSQSNADILLSNTNIQVGTTVTVTSLALQIPVN